MPLASQFQAKLPPGLLPLYSRATTLWGAVGPQTTWIQTAAIMEIGHVLFGWVRSPLQTTVMQVASRFYSVWVVLEFYEVVRRFLTFCHTKQADS
jgi:very-long-chain (3R)-3-hydroxyacyl-CoA dehydratase